MRRRRRRRCWRIAHRRAGHRRHDIGSQLGDHGTTGSSAAGGEAATDFDTSEADREGSLTVGFAFASTYTLDPLDTFGSLQLTYLQPIYDTLLRRAPDGPEIQPGIVTEYEIVDGKTLVLTLRDDAVFSDGTPLDGEAVKVNLERLRDSDTGELNVTFLEISEVVVDSPTQVTVNFATEVAGEFVFALTTDAMMVSPTALEEGVDLKTTAVGAGPYEVVNYVPEQVLELQRKEDHWDAANWPIKTITIRQVDEARRGRPR